jgi:hypothetical protein
MDVCRLDIDVPLPTGGCPSPAADFLSLHRSTFGVAGLIRPRRDGRVMPTERWSSSSRTERAHTIVGRSPPSPPWRISPRCRAAGRSKLQNLRGSAWVPQRSNSPTPASTPSFARSGSAQSLMTAPRSPRSSECCDPEVVFSCLSTFVRPPRSGSCSGCWFRSPFAPRGISCSESRSSTYASRGSSSSSSAVQARPRRAYRGTQADATELTESAARP